jgi:hypothetical protein
MRAVSLAIFVLLYASPAAAQPSDNKTLAEQLFNQGRELAKANNWTAACPKFEASLRYDAALGTKLNLATCYEHVGKLASAWGIYRDAAEMAAKVGDVKRREYALTQASALEPRLPKLTIAAPADTPTGLIVTRDGTAVDAAGLGTALYVDPGKHTITASAPGFKTITREITIDEAKSDTLALPALEPAPQEPKPVDGPAPVAPIDSPPRTRKFVGIGVAAGGVVIAGVGLVFGAKARSSLDSAQTLCGDDLVCRSDADFMRGKKLISEARTQATVSTVLVAAGGVAVAAGLVVWLTAPRGHSVETARLVPAVSADSVGIALSGGF